MEGNEVMLTISPATVKSSSGNSSTVDLRGYLEPLKREITVIMQCGAVSAGTTLDVKLSSSPNDSTWTDIPGATFTQLTTAAGESQIRVKPPARYIRAAWTIAGTSYTFAVIAAISKTKDG